MLLHLEAFGRTFEVGYAKNPNDNHDDPCDEAGVIVDTQMPMTVFGFHVPTIDRSETAEVSTFG